MNRLQLVFVVLFLGGLSSFTQALGNDTVPPVANSTVGQQNFTTPGRNGTLNKPGRNVTYLTGNYTLGNARIMHTKGVKVEQICSGFHFKAWIVMTAANCIINQKIDDLSVEVTYYDFTLKRYVRTYVRVYKVMIDPTFKPGRANYDRAILILETDYHWHVEEFTKVHQYVPPDSLLTKKILVDMWTHNKEKDDYHVQTVQRKVTNDHNKCGEIDNYKEWFCAEKTGGGEVLNKYDIGSPLYYYDGRVKTVLALYSGYKIELTMDGHLYNSLHPSMAWIEKVLADNPTPPKVK